MTPEEQDELQRLHGLVKRYRSRIVALKEGQDAQLRQFCGWLSADIPELHAVEVPRLSESLDRFLALVGDEAARPNRRNENE